MKRFLFLLISLLPLAVAANNEYTPQMYEPATSVPSQKSAKVEAAPETAPVVEVKSSGVDATPVVEEKSGSVDATPVVDEVETMPKKEQKKLQYTDEDGNALKTQYNIVVGTFSDKLNAQNLKEQLEQKGEGEPSIAVGPDGLFRVFYQSFITEKGARDALQKVRNNYPSAWLLNIFK